MSAFAYGQQPTHSSGPQDYSKVDLNNWFDIITFIILPIVILILYLLWRKQVRNRKSTPKN
ncbi:MAG: adenylosuccinate synthetase [Gelidibacter sp.]|nr:adenylosuccinate synthetase [Gelidibacter sp.]